jgi:thiol-disulfide isomerase/thioredoxin
VLYWWASWCPFCAVQSPHMEKLWQAGRGRGLQMLALSVDKNRDAAARYLQQKGYTFPAGMLAPDVAKVLPKPKGLPVTVVRGRDGRTVFAEGGEMFPEDVEGLAKFL